MDGTAPDTQPRLLPVSRIHVSRTDAQSERRRHFDKAAIAELAESIKSVGMLSPIIARPVKIVQKTGLNGIWVPALGKDVFNPDEAEELRRDHVELVAGERRLLAAKAAGLDVVPVSVRELTDEQVLEVQLVENLQREGLHELAEAEGYESLQKLGHSAEEIADKVGKSKAYVYARMKLLALSKNARAAFYGGKLSASTALLLARIPDEKLQLQALKDITADTWTGVMPFKRAAELIQQNYMLRLSEAGFKTEDATLVPAAGACGACPKRTGNQAELFGDVKSADVCTDPVCFKAKREAHAQRLIEQAKSSGQPVLTGKQAKKIFPHNGEYISGDAAVKLTDHCYEDAKRRTYGQILGKDFQPTLVVHPESGKVIPVATRDQVQAVFKEKGVKTSKANESGSQAAAEKKAKLEKAFRTALYAEVRTKFPERLGEDDLRTIAQRFYQAMDQDSRKRIMALWDLAPVKKGYSLDTDSPIQSLLDGAEDAQVTRFLFDLVFVNELQVYTWSKSPPTLLLSAAKKLKVNAEKIRKGLLDAAKVKAKKEAARK